MRQKTGKQGYNIMATENQFKVHPCSEKMKCLLGDYLKNSNGSLLLDDSSFLLFLSRSRQAELSVMNQQFTAVSQSYRIKELQYPSCCTFIKKDRHFMFIYANKNEITVLKFVGKGKDEGFEAGSELCSFRYGFQGSDGFKFLSKPFSINEGDAVLAYSEKDEFYLISLSERGRMVTLEVTKLVDQSKPTGIWSWLTRQKPIHYESIKIVLISCVEDNSYNFLCIRDNTAAVIQIFVRLQEKNKSTFKQLYICSSLPSTINSECSLLSLQLISQDLALLAYSSKSKVVLIKLSIIEEQRSLTLQKVNTNASSTSFQVLQCKQHIYFSFKDALTLSNKCLKFQNSLKQITNSFDTIEPLSESKSPIWLCGNSKELFLINTYNFYQIQEAFENPGVSEQQKRLQSFGSWIQRTINKKIKRQSYLGNYQGIEALLDQKQSKFNEQYIHLQKEKIEANVQISICQDIVCTSIVKSILSKRDYFAALRSYMEHPNIEQELRNMNQIELINNLLVKQSPVEIKCILSIMVRTGMYAYLNEVLEDVTKNPLRQICQEIIQEIFLQVCSQAIHDFRHNSRHKSIGEHKILMEFTFGLIKLDEIDFVDDFLHLANEWSNDEAIFASNLVLNAHLPQNFRHLFIRSKNQLFSSDQVKEMVSGMAQDVRQQYLSHFFREIKEACEDCDEQSHKRGLEKRCATLVRGLQSYQNEIEGIVRDSFPGLLAYLYLNSPNKKEYKGQLLDIAEKCTTPTAAYMLVLANPLDDRKQWKRRLAKIRLCINLALPYSHQADILKQIQEGKHDKISISQVKWERSMKQLEIPKERADKLALKLTLVRQ